MISWFYIKKKRQKHNVQIFKSFSEADYALSRTSLIIRINFLTIFWHDYCVWFLKSWYSCCLVLILIGLLILLRANFIAIVLVLVVSHLTLQSLLLLLNRFAVKATNDAVGTVAVHNLELRLLGSPWCSKCSLLLLSCLAIITLFCSWSFSDDCRRLHLSEVLTNGERRLRWSVIHVAILWSRWESDEGAYLLSFLKHFVCTSWSAWQLSGELVYGYIGVAARHLICVLNWNSLGVKVTLIGCVEGVCARRHERQASLACRTDSWSCKHAGIINQAATCRMVHISGGTELSILPERVN